MKKIFAAFLTVTMLLSSTSCDLDDILSSDTDSTENSVEATEKTNPTEEESKTSEITVSETEATTPVTTITTTTATITTTTPVTTTTTISVTTTTPVTTVTTTTTVITTTTTASTTVTSSTPDFPGSDYQAYLDGTMVVYIAASGNGECYHRVDTCSRMKGNVIAMTKAEAEARGYRPCQISKCFGSYF